MYVLVYTNLLLKHRHAHQLSSGKLYRKATNSLRCYSIALVLLWISVMLGFAGDWVRSTAGFVWKNRSPSAIYNELDAPLPIIMEVSGFTYTLISDTILVRLTSTYRYWLTKSQVWRCNTLWRNIYIKIALVASLMTTAGMSITSHRNNFIEW